MNPLALAAHLNARGYGTPTALERASRRERSESWRLATVGSNVGTQFHLRVSTRAPEGLHAEHAAVALLTLLGNVPVPRQHAQLDPSVGAPAVICEWLDGEDGAVRGVRGDPGVFHQLGRTLSELRAVTFPRAATRPLPEGRFVPRRASWRGEWEARLARLSAARSPLVAALRRAIVDDLPALDRVDAFALVHGDLRPHHVRFTAGGPVVTGWSRALVGDPLMEWASLLTLPPDALAAVLVGAGPDSVAEIRATEPWRRVLLYARTRCLEELAGTSPGPGGAAWAGGVVRRAHELLDADLGGRFDRALAARAPFRVAFVAPAPPDAARTRAHLEALRGADRAGYLDGLVLLGSLAALCMGQWPPRVPACKGAIAPVEPIPERGAWRDALVTALSDGGLALGALALCLGLVARADPDTVDDAVLRGVEALACMLAHTERGEARPGPEAVLRRGWLGVWGRRELGLPALPPSALAYAWEALARSPMTAIPVEEFVARPGARDEASLLGPLLLVCARAGTPGPAAPAALLAALGVPTRAAAPTSPPR